MLDLIGAGLVSFWLDVAGVQAKPIEAFELLALQTSPTLILTPSPAGFEATTIRQYLHKLESLKLRTADQGIWMQSGPMLLANNNGTVPLPAASLTKVATSLAALKSWNPNHQFQTLIGATGPIANGVLQGDLIVNGGGDPFFVWEEAIALGNSLNSLGIHRVTGNLTIVGNFAMNYQTDPQIAGELLKQGLNSATWQAGAKTQYSTLPPGTPRPRVAIAGKVEVATIPIPKQILLVRHHSLPLSQILKEMNVYSNNEMAQMLGQLLGGAEIVRSKAAGAAGVSPSEIILLNSSGLGVENRISPRAVCAMFMAIERELLHYQMDVGDLFPVAGADDRGTLLSRHLPTGTIIKTGTLNEVSALAGVMPTRDRSKVWFAIINRGSALERLRTEQDNLLQRLVTQWHLPPLAPVTVPHSVGDTPINLGATSRNEILYRS